MDDDSRFVICCGGIHVGLLGALHLRIGRLRVTMRRESLRFNNTAFRVLQELVKVILLLHFCINKDLLSICIALLLFCVFLALLIVNLRVVVARYEPVLHGHSVELGGRGGLDIEGTAMRWLPQAEERHLLQLV